MIPLFPYWKFVIYSPLSQAEAFTRLSSLVAPIESRLMFSWQDTRLQEFMGTVSTSEFYLERIIRYRNSFSPTIHGRFFLTETGLQIRIVMMLNSIALLLGVGLICCALPILIAVVYQFFITGHFIESLRTPTLVFAFVYLLFTGGFSYEAITARRLLSQIFDS